MCVAGVWVCYACRPFRKYRILGRFWRPDWPLFGRLFAIGAPISGTMLLEYGVFAAAALLMGRLGTTELAAHQIALTIASIMFMVPFGVSMAATVRVGHAAGRRDVEAHAARRNGRDRARRRVHGGDDAARRSDAQHHSAAVSRVRRPTPPTQRCSSRRCCSLVGASFFIADGVQTVAAGALRGLNDTRMPLLFCGDLLLGDRLRRPATSSASRSATAPSASGSACRSGLRSTRCC